MKLETTSPAPVKNAPKFNVGDGIVFSSRNPNNKDCAKWDITADKLYSVSSVDSTCIDIVDDRGDVQPWSHANEGEHYDVVHRVKVEPPKPEFQPVKIVLESQAEVDYLASMFGASRSSIRKVFNVNDDQGYKVFEQLNYIATPDRPMFSDLQIIRY